MKDRIVGLETVALSKLRPFGPGNPKKRTRKDRELLDHSLDANGYVMPIVARRLSSGELEILDGHGRLERLQRRDDVTDVKVLIVDVETLEEARKILLSLQHVANWDDDALDSWLRDAQGEGFDLAQVPLLSGMGPDDLPVLEEWRDDLQRQREIEVEGHTRTVGDADEVPDDAPARASDGDLWELGGSRLLVGDSTRDADVDRAIGDLKVQAVVTDPPYAIYGSSSGIASDVADDKMVRPFFEAVWKQIARVLPEQGHAYCFMDWRSWSASWEAAKRARMSPANMLVWDKGNGGLGSTYMLCHELIAFFVRRPQQKVMKSRDATPARTVRGRSNVLRYPRVTGDERLHNAAKPVELLKELIVNSTDEGAAVVDLFGGSGSTLIAAHAAGRRCAMLEIEPKTADIILARFERATGIAPRKRMDVH